MKDDTEDEGDEHDDTAEGRDGLEYSRNYYLKILQKPAVQHFEGCR